MKSCWNFYKKELMYYLIKNVDYQTKEVKRIFIIKRKTPIGNGFNDYGKIHEIIVNKQNWHIGGNYYLYQSEILDSDRRLKNIKDRLHLNLL